MIIHIHFDDQLSSSSEKTNSNLLFGISWEHNGLYYPTEGWLDFGCVILGWWVRVAVQLIDGSDRELFSFMDGPYSIEARLDRNSKEVTLSPQKLNLVWVISLVELVQALTKAAAEVYKELQNRGIGEREQNILKRYAEILDECLSKVC